MIAIDRLYFLLKKNLCIELTNLTIPFVSKVSISNSHLETLDDHVI